MKMLSKTCIKRLIVGLCIMCYLVVGSYTYGFVNAWHWCNEESENYNYTACYLAVDTDAKISGLTWPFYWLKTLGKYLVPQNKIERKGEWFPKKKENKNED